MKKSKRLIVLILGCMMLIGGTLTASAATKSAPYNSPCQSCGYNAGEKLGDINCLYNCESPAGRYRCGHCGKTYGWCTSNHYMYGI